MGDGKGRKGKQRNEAKRNRPRKVKDIKKVQRERKEMM